MHKILYRMPIILLLAGLLLASGCTTEMHRAEKAVDSSSSPAVNSSPVNRSEEKPPPKVIEPDQPNAPVAAQQSAKPIKALPASGRKVSQEISISAVGEGKIFFTLTNFPLQNGETVFAVTKRAADKTGVKLNVSGIAVTAYVAGIGGLQEFDRGPMSGWIYKVNGVYPNIGAGTNKLKPGDQIEWIYSTGEQKLN